MFLFFVFYFCGVSLVPLSFKTKFEFSFLSIHHWTEACLQQDPKPRWRQTLRNHVFSGATVTCCHMFKTCCQWVRRTLNVLENATFKDIPLLLRRPAIQTGCWSDIFRFILDPSIFVNILNNYFFPNHSKSIEADIGEGIAEVQLTEWFVKEGDMARNLSPPANLHWKTTSNKRLSYDFHMIFMLGQRNG